MKKVNHILQNLKYRHIIEQINILEEKRSYCKHGLAHLLDVARIAYIISLENQYEVSKEVIYGAALLHDIGKAGQYLNGIPHNVESVRIAPDIWREAGYNQEEIKIMTEAVLDHRKPTEINGNHLKSILYIADKKSRACFDCETESTCNWPSNEKNIELEY